MISLLVLILLYETKIAKSIEYTPENSKDTFNLFKEKYHKIYKNKTLESEHFNNFIVNLNEVEKLNGGKNETYAINQYADLDPTEFEQRYAIDVKPYSIVSQNGNMTVRTQMQADIDPSKLYNLNDADELFKNYLQKYKTKKYRSKFKRLKHYYRFVKTLIKINREIVQGGNETVLDEKADVLDEPFEYMY